MEGGKEAAFGTGDLDIGQYRDAIPGDAVLELMDEKEPMYTRLFLPQASIFENTGIGRMQLVDNELCIGKFPCRLSHS